jgi:hypothetical protein
MSSTAAQGSGYPFNYWHHYLATSKLFDPKVALSQSLQNLGIPGFQVSTSRLLLLDGASTLHQIIAQNLEVRE